MNLTKNKHKEKRNHTNTHNTPHKSAACHTCLMLASTIQFSHNTPTTPCQHNKCQQATWSGTKKVIMPQTPNNAPTYKQILFSNCARHCVSQSAIQTLGLALKVCISPGFYKQRWQHDTRTLNQHPPQSGRTAQLCLIIKLLRKEVIHPHLPVRVPCYDFVPIADPTFDGSLTSLGHRLRVLPTFMT